MNRTSYDAVVVGSGPNGLSAALVLSTAGLSVLVLEGRSRMGGGCRTEELTLPGFHHDVCSAIHPMAKASPFFQSARLEEYGLKWETPPIAVAHPFDDGRAAWVSPHLAEMQEPLGTDAEAWTRLMRPYVERADTFFNAILRPIRIPAHPLMMAGFGLHALQSCDRLVRTFDHQPARALFAGNAAHSILPLTAAGSASFGLVLAIAGHAVGWPCARGGSQQIADALVAAAAAKGCEFATDHQIRSLRDVPAARAVLFDVTPRQLDAIAGSELGASYRARIAKFRYGPGVFKIDYALSGPIPWRSPKCLDAATIHVGGTYEEIARAETEANSGRISETPFVLVAQQSLFDNSRAPAGKHTGWAYCHVPSGSTVDMTDRIERQIERFAPGFRDRVLARHVMPPQALETHNPNLVGGDIGGGANALDQVLFRPVPQWDPYATGNPRLFLCSSSTPPGGGVHGMCGYWAARSVLRNVFRFRQSA